jgi:hypothetical protein
VSVHKVSQVGAEQARTELQVVILEWLGTTAKLAVHLAQVSQSIICRERVDAFHAVKADKTAKKARSFGRLASWLHIGRTRSLRCF